MMVCGRRSEVAATSVACSCELGLNLGREFAAKRERDQLCL